jgi:hypothetical protein
MTVQNFKAQSVVLEKGSPCDHIIIVLEGLFLIIINRLINYAK